MLWVLICWIWIRGFIDAGPHQLDPSPGFIVAGPYLLDLDPGIHCCGSASAGSESGIPCCVSLSAGSGSGDSLLRVGISWIQIRIFIVAGLHQFEPDPGFIVAGPYLLDPDPGFIVAGAHQLDESRSGDSILRILLIKGILKNGLSNWFRAFFRDAAFHVRREKKIYFFNS